MSNYDSWKTTDPADEQLGSTMGSRSTRMQCAADDAAVIAEEIECLSNLLDRFMENHGADLSDRLEALLPNVAINKALAKKIAAFAHSLEPVED